MAFPLTASCSAVVWTNTISDEDVPKLDFLTSQKLREPTAVRG
jgi:hypothetical protein